MTYLSFQELQAKVAVMMITFAEYTTSGGEERSLTGGQELADALSDRHGRREEIYTII